MKSFDGFHCQIATKSSRDPIRDAVTFVSVTNNLSFSNVRSVGQFASVA